MVTLLKDQISSLPQEELAEVELVRENEPLVKAALILRAFGIPSDVIEENLSVDDGTVQTALKIKEFHDLYSKLAVKVKSLDPDAVIGRMLPLALLQKENILTNPSVGIQLKDRVASEILDRHLGKPVMRQEVKSMTFNVSAKEKDLDSSIESLVTRIKELESHRKKVAQVKNAS